MNTTVSMALALVLGWFAAAPQNQPQTPPAPPTAPQANDEKLDRVAEIIAGKLPQLHGSDVWRQKTAIQADLKIDIGGEPVLEGVLTYETNRHRARIDLKNGGFIIHDGQNVQTASTNLSEVEARRHLELWPTLLAAPFQLRHRNVQPSQFRSVYLKGVNYDSIRLNYKAADGKANGDWRLVYSDVKRHLVKGLANVPLGPFIKEAAASDQFAVMLDDYTDVEGVKLASKWTFWKWDNELLGEPLGTAALTNMKFTVPESDFFTSQPPQPARPAAPESKDSPASP